VFVLKHSVSLFLFAICCCDNVWVVNTSISVYSGSSSYSELLLWDVIALQQVGVLTGGNCIAFHRNGKYLASGCINKARCFVNINLVGVV
jgi:hypothetical protein